MESLLFCTVQMYTLVLSVTPLQKDREEKNENESTKDFTMTKRRSSSFEKVIRAAERVALPRTKAFQDPKLTNFMTLATPMKPF